MRRMWKNLAERERWDEEGYFGKCSVSLRRVYHGFGVYERKRSESVEEKSRVHKAKWWGWCPMWSKEIDSDPLTVPSVVVGVCCIQQRMDEHSLPSATLVTNPSSLSLSLSLSQSVVLKNHLPFP
ncbi:unnamed protein product [Sphenostylis stenocarpa]|uniref:Uncharacterized protein n=1 Tax=Sphenostylis stenocarpa TaxID=92480 RepID=A0AA86W1I5_9FABA|nr:unnamed protein product [Sphenostylis stenocarpa]